MIYCEVCMFWIVYKLIHFHNNYFISIVSSQFCTVLPRSIYRNFGSDVYAVSTQHYVYRMCVQGYGKTVHSQLHLKLLWVNIC